MKARDKLIANNWVYEKTPEEQYTIKQKKYYNRIYLSRNKTQYYVNNKYNFYLGVVPTIEEALYLRDLYFNESDTDKIPSVETLDLKTNNPYIHDGLDYRLPERLKLKKPRTEGYGFGVIRKRKNHYRLEQGGKYYATCITYEQAYFYYQELNKRGWDKKNLPGIKEDYPEWYTWLNRFYIYITRETVNKQSNWKLAFTPSNNPEDKLDYILYVNLEDALYERDFLMEHNWDYDLLVECIDDSKNPYYDMELPPFPERKIRKVALEYNHDKELEKMRDYIYTHGDINRNDMAKILNVTGQTLSNWFKKYNTTWTRFKKICLKGEDPLKYFTMEKTIYTPDLSPAKPKHFRNYVHKNKNNKSCDYKIVKDSVYYGSYPTWEIANKVSNLLQEHGWTQENRKKFQKEYGVAFQDNKYNNIYPTPAGHYVIRRKNKKRQTINYGTYHTHLEASIVKLLLVDCNWDKNKLLSIKAEAKKLLRRVLAFQDNMFHGCDGLWI